RHHQPRRARRARYQTGAARARDRAHAAPDPHHRRAAHGAAVAARVEGAAPRRHAPRAAAREGRGFDHRGARRAARGGRDGGGRRDRGGGPRGRVRGAHAERRTMTHYGLYALFYKEVLRFSKVLLQTLLAPIVTALLYLAVFGQALAGRADVF